MGCRELKVIEYVHGSTAYIQLSHLALLPNNSESAVLLGSKGYINKSP